MILCFFYIFGKNLSHDDEIKNHDEGTMIMMMMMMTGLVAQLWKWKVLCSFVRNYGKYSFFLKSSSQIIIIHSHWSTQLFALSLALSAIMMMVFFGTCACYIMCRKITKDCVWHTGTGKKAHQKVFFIFILMK